MVRSFDSVLYRDSRLTCFGTASIRSARAFLKPVDPAELPFRRHCQAARFSPWPRDVAHELGRRLLQSGPDLGLAERVLVSGGGHAAEVHSCFQTWAAVCACRSQLRWAGWRRSQAKGRGFPTRPTLEDAFVELTLRPVLPCGTRIYCTFSLGFRGQMYNSFGAAREHCASRSVDHLGRIRPRDT